MATKSFLKNIDIRNRKSCSKFVSALENAQNKSGEEVVMSKRVNIVKKADIKKFFGVADEQRL